MRPRHPVIAVLMVTAGLLVACQGSGAPGTSPAGSPASPSATASPAGSPAASPTQSVAGPSTGPGGCSIAPPTSPPSGLTLHVCYSISGAVTASGGFIDTGQGAGALSCADWALNGGGAAGSAVDSLQAPDPGDAGVTAGGQDLSLYLSILPYTGPGSYSSTAAAQSVSLGDTLSWSTNTGQGATFSAQVGADGSGSVTATGLGEDSSNGTTESASESWTCAMEAGTP